MKMTRLTLILLLFILTSCRATKQATTYEKVKNGKGLDNVTLISFDSFFNRWVFNRKIQKIDLNIRELNRDNQFIYFGKPRLGLTQTKWTFFKIYSDTITERFPNYKDFFGDELRDYLWNKVIPKEDVDLWNYNRTTQQNEIKSKCPNKRNKPINKYALKDNKVVLTMTWEIECVELERLKNKVYKASYNLLTKQYESKSIEND